MRFSAFQAQLRQELNAVGDAGRAEQQRRYLKSAMPMYGVGIPEVRRIAQSLAATHATLWVRDKWERNLTRLWDEADHREERIATLAIVRAKLSAEYRTEVSALALYEHFIRSGQWWDLVDETSHPVGLVLRAHPEQAETIRAWAKDPELWIRRSAIICQLRLKAKVNTSLLSDVIEANLTDPEFFIRKAIGWALRDYARSYPGWVRAFVAAHPEMSALSYREATKYL